MDKLNSILKRGSSNFLLVLMCQLLVPIIVILDIMMEIKSPVHMVFGGLLFIIGILWGIELIYAIEREMSN